jgi:hypothetical protein
MRKPWGTSALGLCAGRTSVDTVSPQMVTDMTHSATAISCILTTQQLPNIISREFLGVFELSPLPGTLLPDRNVFFPGEAIRARFPLFCISTGFRRCP